MSTRSKNKEKQSKPKSLAGLFGLHRRSKRRDDKTKELDKNISKDNTDNVRKLSLIEKDNNFNENDSCTNVKEKQINNNLKTHTNFQTKEIHENVNGTDDKIKEKNTYTNLNNLKQIPQGSPIGFKSIKTKTAKTVSVNHHFQTKFRNGCLDNLIDQLHSPSTDVVLINTELDLNADKVKTSYSEKIGERLANLENGIVNDNGSENNDCQVTAQVETKAKNENNNTYNELNMTNRYSLETLDINVTLGTGTFGRVFLAEDINNDQIYAMKIMKIQDVIKLNQVEHVNSEREILLTVEHPFIVECLWTFRDTKCLYMLFEYVSGGELFTHLRNKIRFNEEETLFYLTEIISVLEYLHKLAIVYRDLKPENLLLDSEGHLKFTDFGFSKVLSNDTTWTLCGTPEYLSPEAIQGKGHDCSCDWWALGILTYEMLVGEAPFVDDHPFGLYEKILACRINWPPYLKNTDQQDFIQQLIVLDRTQRLGKGYNGTCNVKDHKWLKGINWDDVYMKKLKPPIKPKVAFSGDTSNFDDFDEDWDLLHTADASLIDREKFKDWQDKQ